MTVDRVGCVGSTMRTMSGHYLDLTNPDPNHIVIEDIAHALGNICRYGGHVGKFYSVAEHSFAAVLYAAIDGRSAEECLSILMHDAVEAYVGDMIKPLKVLCPQYSEIEKRLELTIYAALGITLHETVNRLYDLQMLKAERMYFFPDDPTEWTGLDLVVHRHYTPVCWAPSYASVLFLKRYQDLKDHV